MAYDDLQPSIKNTPIGQIWESVKQDEASSAVRSGNAEFSSIIVSK